MKKNIVIDGSTLSLLLYAHTNGNGNQMGFLLGYKAEDVQDRISDSQIHTEDTKCYIYISSFVPWPSLKFLHRRSDSVNVKDVHKAHEGINEEIVGWYSFRHQSSLRPSLKEASTHHHLTALDEFEDNQDFLFFLCTSSASPNLSTHSSNHAFMSYDPCSRTFKAVTTRIRNLGDTSKLEYQKPSMIFTIHSHQAQNVVEKSRKEFIRPTGQIDQVVKMKHFAESMGQNLDMLQGQVNKSEANLSRLEKEVRYLRRKMAHLETKDMSLTFCREQERIKEEMEDSLQKESLKEADEEEQISKLVADLGLSPSVTSSIFQKPEERIRKLSQDQDNLISWEKMEVNPLYASTLNNNRAPSPVPENVQKGSTKLMEEDVDSYGSNSSSMKGIESTSENISSVHNNEESSHQKFAKGSSKDPFAFVEQFKSEFGVSKSASSTGVLHNRSHAMTSVKLSTGQSPVSRHDHKEHFKPVQCDSDDMETDSPADDAISLSSSPKLNGSREVIRNQADFEKNPSKMSSSSPTF